MKAKTAVVEAIPAAFVDAMKEVVALIEIGHFEVSIESDDLVQIGDVCGGLYSAVTQRFGFCHCLRGPDGEALQDQRGTVEWCYDLSAAEISDVATGSITTRGMWRCSDYDCGRRWSEPDGYCPLCDFPP